MSILIIFVASAILYAVALYGPVPVIPSQRR